MEILNVGTVANDGTGDKGRNAFIKIKNNFSALESRVPPAQKFTGITADIELDEWTPATGVYNVEGLILKNETENSAQLSFGLCPGGIILAARFSSMLNQLIRPP